MRRGQPSVHAAYGEPLALLAGDGLIVLAFETVALAAVADPLRAASLSLIVARAVGMPHGIVAGQGWESEAVAGPRALPARQDRLALCRRRHGGRRRRRPCGRALGHARLSPRRGLSGGRRHPRRDVQRQGHRQAGRPGRGARPAQRGARIRPRAARRASWRHSSRMPPSRCRTASAPPPSRRRSARRPAASCPRKPPSTRPDADGGRARGPILSRLARPLPRLPQPQGRRPRLPALGRALRADAADRAAAGTRSCSISPPASSIRRCSPPACASTCSTCSPTARSTSTPSPRETGLPPDGVERLLKAAAALDLVEARSGGRYALGSARRGAGRQ